MMLRDYIGWEYNDSDKLSRGWYPMQFYPLGYSYRKANIPIEDHYVH
jgi:hypothetical protein